MGGTETQMTGTSENKTKATNSFLTLMIRSFRQREEGREKNEGDTMCYHGLCLSVCIQIAHFPMNPFVCLFDQCTEMIVEQRLIWSGSQTKTLMECKETPRTAKYIYNDDLRHLLFNVSFSQNFKQKFSSSVTVASISIV